MILRRITKHVKDQNWFAVGLDFLIVIMGILIAFQITNWNETRQDRAEEAIFLRDLHDDILRASSQSARTEFLRVNQARDLETAVELVFSETPDRELSEPECTAIAYSFTNNVSRSRLPSLIQLQTAGRTGIISDRNLARQLAELTQRHEALGTIIREVLFTGIVLKYPDLFQTKTVMAPIAGSAGEFERDAETVCHLSEIRAHRALLNDIIYNADAYDAFMRDGFTPWVEQMRAVHARVDALLGVSHEEAAL